MKSPNKKTNTTQAEMHYIILYADEFPIDVWSDYCKAACVPYYATEIRIPFLPQDVVYEPDDIDDDEEEAEEDA